MSASLKVRFVVVSLLAVAAVAASTATIDVGFGPGGGDGDGGSDGRRRDWRAELKKHTEAFAKLQEKINATLELSESVSTSDLPLSGR